MKAPDNFLTAGPPFVVKLLNTLGYSPSYTGSTLWMGGRRITAWVEDVPVSCEIIRQNPKVRRVEFFVPETHSWETAVRDCAEGMSNEKVTATIRKKLNAIRQTLGIMQPVFKHPARLSAIGYDDGVAQMFSFLSREEIGRLNEGKPLKVAYRGEIRTEMPFHVDLHLIPTAQDDEHG